MIRTLGVTVSAARKAADDAKLALDNVEKKRDAHLAKLKALGKTLDPERAAAAVAKMQREMETTSISIREEKERLREMSKIKEAARAAAEMQAKLDELTNARNGLRDEVKHKFAALEEARQELWRHEAASELGVAAEDLTDRRVPVSAALAELLGTALWKKRLRAEHAVSVRPQSQGSAHHARLVGVEAAVDATAAFLAAMPAVATRVLPLTDAERAALIGPKGATIARLEESTGCGLELRGGGRRGGADERNGGSSANGASRKPSSDSVCIAGAVADVERAVTEIRKHLTGQVRTTVVVDFSPGQKGTLVGNKGATINSIRKESNGASLDLVGETSVRISGPAVAVKAARAAVATLLKLDAASVQVISVPASALAGVVGRGGSKLRQIEEAHMRGSKEGVVAALAVLAGAIADEEYVVETIQVQSRHVGMLLGKNGANTLRIQREVGVKLEVASSAEGRESQTVTLKGGRGRVKRAAAAVEAILQYNAPCCKTVKIERNLIHLVIGRAGEEICRIREETGAAIDAISSEKQGLLELRGSETSVAAAVSAIDEVVKANRVVTKSTMLPWHCIDKLIGVNGDELRSFESTYDVELELPGETLPSDQLNMGAFIPSIPTSLALRGKQKHLAAAIAAVDDLSLKHFTDVLQLEDADAETLARMCNADEAFLKNLGDASDASLDYEAAEGRVLLRGEGRHVARQALERRIAEERFATASIELPAFQRDILAAEPEALTEVAALCAPDTAIVALQDEVEGVSPASLELLAPARTLEEAATRARAWVAERNYTMRDIHTSPEVMPLLNERLQDIGMAHHVRFKLVEPTRLVVSGALVRVNPAYDEVTAIVAANSIEERVLQLEVHRWHLMLAYMWRLRQNHSRFDVSWDRETSRLSLRGTAVNVNAIIDEINGMFDEAEEGGGLVKQPINGAQVDLLNRPPRGANPPARGQRQPEPPIKKLSREHGVALIIDRDAMNLTVYGPPTAVASVQAELETFLDVDVHEEDVGTSNTACVIGRGGSNVQMLQEKSGATISVDRNLGIVRLSGSTEQVRRGRDALRKLLDEQTIEAEVPLSMREIPIVIGRGGSNIKKLQADSGATISVHKDDMVARARGSKAEVALAAKAIEDLLAAFRVDPPPPGLVTRTPAPPGL